VGNVDTAEKPMQQIELADRGEIGQWRRGKTRTSCLPQGELGIG
jgi:hypothetical protein